MTAPFGRRNLAPAPQSARLPAQNRPDLVLTPEQRAFIFAGQETEKAADGISLNALPPMFERPPIRRAGWIACAAMTAVTLALSPAGGPEVALSGLPIALESLNREAMARIGAYARPFAMVWSSLFTFANLGANLWLTRKLAATISLASPLAFAALGGAVASGLAFLAGAFGLGESDIGLWAEALTGGAAAGLYRLLAGSLTPWIADGGRGSA